MVYSKRKIPAHVMAKADAIIEKFNNREIYPTKHHSGRGESLNVGKDWRLYRRTGKTEFELMSHERYTRVKDKK